MSAPLTLAYITSRRDCRIEWFFASLAKQIDRNTKYEIIVIDHFYDERPYQLPGNSYFGFENVSIRHRSPKPTIWQGPHRITKEDWWAKSNALNTAICLCESDWIAFADDRSVLMPGWLDCIKEAMNENWAVVGTYAKHANLKVEGGEITDMGTVLGIDHRPQSGGPYPTKDWYGGHAALPLEWCLRVNGFSEDLCDSLGSEDSMFGLALYNSGYSIRYDPRMKIIEDRTQGEIDGALKRSDWGVSPNDASHKIVELLQHQTTSQNSFDIRKLRDSTILGEPFPPPFASHVHWFSGEDIATKFDAVP